MAGGRGCEVQVGLHLPRALFRNRAGWSADGEGLAWRRGLKTGQRRAGRSWPRRDGRRDRLWQEGRRTEWLQPHTA